jgi:hypothetical protein
MRGALAKAFRQPVGGPVLYGKKREKEGREKKEATPSFRIIVKTSERKAGAAFQLTPISSNYVYYEWGAKIAAWEVYFFS